MSFYDTIANIQKNLAHPNNVQGPFNSDGKVNFGTAKDIAKGLPKQPGEYAKNISNAQGAASFNDTIEKNRQLAMGFAASNLGKPQGIANLAAAGGALGLLGGPAGAATGAITGAAIGTGMYGMAELDKATNGNFSKAMMAGTKGIRSNYAFISDVTKHNTAMGLLSGLGIIAGAALGAGAIVLTGGAAAPAVAAAVIGAYGAGKAERVLAGHGAFNFINPNIRDSAVYSQSEAGQKQYNFGRDVIHAAAKVTGNKDLANTDKGIGAVLSGVINFAAEAALTPEVKGVQLGGNLTKTAVSGGIQAGTQGVAARVMGKFINEPARQAERMAKEAEIVNKTVAGEQTVYTPLFKFISENDAATVGQRAGFKGTQAGQLAASLMAGKSMEEIGLIYRGTSLGDVNALAELQAKHASTYNQILRYEGVLSEVEGAANRRVAFGLTREDGTPIVLGNKMDDNYKLINAELDSIRAKYTHLDQAMSLQGALTQTGVSKIDPFLKRLGIDGIEQFRNDVARQGIAAKLGDKQYSLSERETALGNTIQRISTEHSALGAVVRFVERSMDDKAHQTVPFNNTAMANSRVRTNVREAISRNLLPEVQGRDIYNQFVSATSEQQKLAAMQRIEQNVFDGLAAKHGIPKEMSDFVLANYVRITRDNIDKAKSAFSEKKAYMIDENGDTLVNPQLVSQLANGHYLPNIELLDKAFARYAKKHGQDLKMPQNLALGGKLVYDEFQSLWRSITLARIGFPINIMRDTALRAWGDGALFDMMKQLGSDVHHSLTNANNTVANIKNWDKIVLDKSHNLRYITKEIDAHTKALQESDRILKDLKYDVNNPKTVTLAVQKNLEYRDRIQGIVNGLKAREQELISGTQKKTVGRESISILGEQFPHGSSGVMGKINYSELAGHDTMRGLMSSNRELVMENISRDRTGGHSIKPTQFNEKLHLKSWENVLNNTLVNDPIAKMIMSHKSKQEIVAWIKSPASGDYIQRFGYDDTLKRGLRYSDTDAIYNRVLNTVNQFAPDSKLWDPLLGGSLDVKKLKQLYPDWSTRPEIITDMAENLLGRSNLARKAANGVKEMTTWLATQPTSRLMYNPYFNVKYEHKLQSLVALANEQGLKLTERHKADFERTARKYAMDEFHAKINAFNRDMNYPGFMNHFLAFFPALVEQFRAYGKITAEHPEFPMRALSMSPTSMANVPGYIGDPQTDANGNQYIEVTLPILGIKGRLPTSWFNPINPTGGHILSASPVSGLAINELAKSGKVKDSITNALLPFGAQANALGYLEPTTIRRTAQLIQASITKNGDQFNKDVAMFMDMKTQQFIDENHKMPVGNDLANMYAEAKNDSVSLAAVRAMGSLTLPAQPQYVSPLQHYSDILSQYMKDYGKAGSEKFVNDYPEYFMLMDKLSNNNAGLMSDKTAVSLVQKNKSVIEKMVAQSKDFDLTTLGAVFNDSNYQFSSSARAWLQTNTIPGTRKKFIEQGEALNNASSAIVNQGWNQWRRMITIVEDQLKQNDPPLSPSKGYGKAIMDGYKQQFVEAMKTQNKMWYDVKTNPNIINRQKDLIDALSIAANTPSLWKDLSQQPRWHSIVDYLNMRYKVYDELKRRGTSIDANKAADIREQVGDFVDNLRKTDVNFADFYDRYLDGDQFKYVRED